MIYRDIKVFQINSIFLSNKYNTNQNNQQQNDLNKEYRVNFRIFKY